MAVRPNDHKGTVESNHHRVNHSAAKLSGSRKNKRKLTQKKKCFDIGFYSQHCIPFQSMFWSQGTQTISNQQCHSNDQHCDVQQVTHGEQGMVKRFHHPCAPFLTIETEQVLHPQPFVVVLGLTHVKCMLQPLRSVPFHTNPRRTCVHALKIVVFQWPRTAKTESMHFV